VNHAIPVATALAAKRRGSTTAGESRASSRDTQTTATSEAMAPTAIIAGRLFTKNVERNSASRIALPATC
jgi:hypothetical protein